MADNLPFLFLKNNPVNYKFQGRGGGGEANIPLRNRNQHSSKLLQELNNTITIFQQAKDNREQDGLPNRKGNYFKFEGRASYDLMTDQLESIKKINRIIISGLRCCSGCCSLIVVFTTNRSKCH